MTYLRFLDSQYHIFKVKHAAMRRIANVRCMEIIQAEHLDVGQREGCGVDWCGMAGLGGLVENERNKMFFLLQKNNTRKKKTSIQRNKPGAL